MRSGSKAAGRKPPITNSGKTAATFFQIEWRISLMIDLQLASQMPLIQP